MRTISAQDNPELMGWMMAGATPRSATMVQQLKSGTGMVQFVTLLLPAETGAESPL